jgi:Uncharacterised methyltransferase family (DUF6094)
VTIQGNAFDAVATPESFSLLYLNPPYDSEIRSVGNNRMERLFLEHTFRWLVTEGVLVLVIPFERLHECAGILSSHFASLNIFRMTDEESVRFRQIAVLGVRRNVRGVAVEEARRQLQRISPYGSFQALPELAPEACEPYSVPPTGEAALSYRGLPYDLLEDLLLLSGAWKQTMPFLMPREDVATGRPITPLHGGHVGLLCTAGLLNGVFGHGDEKDVTLRLETVLRQAGLRVAVLRSSVATDKREEWYERQLKAGVEVVICHPKLVETGLDLLAFPTLYFYETGYSLHTLRQASRRSWRIGQRHAVRVKFVTYTGTMQETCLRLMGKKMLVALMMEGEFSGEGLQSLDTDEDLMSAMARELVEKAGVGASADQMWRELERERERVLPQTPAAQVEEDLNPVLYLSGAELTDSSAEEAGIHLVDPPAGVKVRKKSSPWSSGSEPAEQLSLFG